jgi:hypothetical protein
MKKIFLFLALIAIISHAEGSSLDEQIKIYQSFLKTSPKSVPALNKLAYMYTRKVRQTVDFSYNTSAEKLVQTRLSIEFSNHIHGSTPLCRSARYRIESNWCE